MATTFTFSKIVERMKVQQKRNELRIILFAHLSLSICLCIGKAWCRPGHHTTTYCNAQPFIIFESSKARFFFCSLHVHFLSLLRTGRATFDVFIFTIAVRFVVVDVICCRLCLRDQPLWCTVIPLDSDFSLLFAIRLVSLYYLGNFSCVAQRLSNEHKVHNGPLIKLLCRQTGKKGHSGAFGWPGCAAKGGTKTLNFFILVRHTKRIFHTRDNIFQWECERTHQSQYLHSLTKTQNIYYGCNKNGNLDVLLATADLMIYMYVFHSVEHLFFSFFLFFFYCHWHIFCCCLSIYFILAVVRFMHAAAACVTFFQYASLVVRCVCFFFLLIDFRLGYACGSNNILSNIWCMNGDSVQLS